MQLVHVRCPKCGAGVSVAEGAGTATCEYCGTQSAVSRRTRFLERKLPPKVQAAQQLPIAVQRHSSGWVLWAILVPVLLAVGAAVVVPLALKKQLGIMSDFWGGGHPMLADVNGDGAADVIGLVRAIQSDDATRVVAYDGKTGDELWTSKALGKFGDVNLSKIGIVGDRVVLALASGSAMALDLKTGKQVWAGAPLAEKPNRLCAGGAGEVVVDTADRRRVVLALADGTVKSDQGFESNAQPRCEPVWGNAANSQPGMYVSKYPYRAHDDPNYLGEVMRVGWSLTTGDGQFVAMGSKKQGTGIPFVGLYKAEPEGEIESTAMPVWTSPVPASNPLEADTGEPDHAAVADGVVYVGYETKEDVIHVVAFDIATGKRRWDKALPKPERGSSVLAGIGAVGDTLMVSTWSGFFLLDPKDATIRIHNGM